MNAPLLYGSVQRGAVCYVSERVIQEAVARAEWLRVCRLGHTVTSVELPGRTWLKRSAPWGTFEQWGQAAEWWQSKGIKPPASPAGLMRAAAPEWYQTLPWSLAGALWPGVRGPWQEASVRGIILGPHKVLDIRRAYRWALEATGGGQLPAREGMQIATSFTYSRPGYHCVEVEPVPSAPWPLRNGGVVVLETPIDMERWGRVTVRRWIGGVTVRAWTRTDPLAELVDDCGVPAVARSYWGPWVGRLGVTTTWRSGKVSQMRPRGLDPIRAHCITARVRERMVAIETPYRYVDSVIVPERARVPLGDRVGDWRSVKEYPAGVWIGWPGAYGTPGAPPDKLSGISSENRKVWAA